MIFPIPLFKLFISTLNHADPVQSLKQLFLIHLSLSKGSLPTTVCVVFQLMLHHPRPAPSSTGYLYLLTSITLRCDESLAVTKIEDNYCFSLINKVFYSDMKGSLNHFTQLFVFDNYMLAIIHLFVLFYTLTKVWLFVPVFFRELKLNWTICKSWLLLFFPFKGKNYDCTFPGF